MTLDEAIYHAEEASVRLAQKCDTQQCAREHKQLADWLRELKERRDKDAQMTDNFIKTGN